MTRDKDKPKVPFHYSNDRIKAWKQGYSACQAGLSTCACDWLPNSERGSAWFEGYHACWKYAQSKGY